MVTFWVVVASSWSGAPFRSRPASYFTLTSVSPGVGGDDVNGQSKLFGWGAAAHAKVNLALLKARSEMARLPPKRAISLLDPVPPMDPL
jgi:hypothetical protein